MATSQNETKWRRKLKLNFNPTSSPHSFPPTLTGKEKKKKEKNPNMKQKSFPHKCWSQTENEKKKYVFFDTKTFLFAEFCQADYLQLEVEHLEWRAEIEM